MQSCIPTIPLFPPTPSFHCIFQSIFLSHLFNVFNSDVCSASHVYSRMLCIIVNGGYCDRAMGCYSTSTKQSPLLSPWEFYGPLVCSVASDILIYNPIFVKNVSLPVLMRPHVSLLMEQIMSLPVFLLRQMWSRCLNLEI